MHLRPSELVALYATEWLILGFFGLILAAFFAVLDSLAMRSPWRLPYGIVSRSGFAMVVAVVLFFGSIAWATSFKHLPPPSMRPWVVVLVIGVLCIGGLAAIGKLSQELTTLARLGRFSSLAGALTLLSLPFAPGIRAIPAAEAHADAVVVGKRPNIVLISIDALAASHLTPYGSVRQTSPALANFADHAMVFERFHANANFTSSGIATILNGVAPWTHRVLGQTGRASAKFTQDSFPAHLQAAGYLMAYFGSNPWAGGRVQGVGDYFDHKDAYLDWEFGPCFDRLAGFIPYLCAAASSRLISYSYSAVAHAASGIGLISIEPHSDVEAMTSRAIRWSDAAGKQKAPVFMWVHLFPPHDPYAAPQPWLGSFDHSSVASTPATSHPSTLFDAASDSASRVDSLEARYDESIAYVDHYLGELIEAVGRNLGPNTAIMITADHGESFDHGYGAHGGVMLYEDLIHIPMIVAIPGEKPGRRTELASQIDIAPTIAALAGIPPSPSWEGRSLLAAPATADSPIFAMSFEENATHRPLTTGSTAILKENWKFVHFIGDPRYPHEPGLQDQLFDLQADPREHVNLAAAHPDVAAALTSEINQQLAVHGGAARLN